MEKSMLLFDHNDDVNYVTDWKTDGSLVLGISSVSNCGDFMEIHFYSGTLLLKAYGECCSTSILLTSFEREELIGETIDWIKKEEEECCDQQIIAKFPRPTKEEREQGSISEIYYRIACYSGNEFYLMVRNFSNGYYTGSLTGRWIAKDKPLIVMRKVIFVVGLPASGKSTFARQTYPGIKIYDDDSLVEEIPFGDKVFKEEVVVIVSAKFTNVEYYTNFTAQWQLATSDILTYCFENNPKQSLFNNEMRGGRNMKAIETDIIKMTEFYNDDNSDYINVIKLPTYSG